VTSIRPRSLPPTDDRLDAELVTLGARAADFAELDMKAALDVDARIRDTPSEKQTKGMFLEQLARAARAVGGASPTRYVTFRDYPLREFMRLMADTAALRHPGLPLREAFRRVGSDAFSTLMNSVPGRVLYRLARGNVRAALCLAPEAYKHTLSHCSVSVRLEAPRQVVLEFRDVWNFPECYHVGVVEGACRAFGAEPRVRACVRSACDVDLLVRW
jgi:uncharacterized protein (TIGR02265 family)